MTMKDNKRAKNFSTAETKILIHLVKERINVLECKKTDAVAYKEKIDAWKEIEKEFNKLSGETFRDFKILKGKYENLKKTSRRKFTEEMQHVNGTGNVTQNKQLALTCVELEIKDILDASQINEKHPDFDSDSTFVHMETTELVENDVDSLEPMCVISTEKTKSLPNNNREKIDLASTETELVDIQKQIYEQQLKFNKEEHAMKIEEHKLRMESLKLDIRLKQIEVKLKEESLSSRR